MDQSSMALTGRIQSLGVRALGHEAHVVEVSRSSPSVVRVRAAARRVVDTVFAPGCKIKVHVGDGQMRSYTPVAVDPRAGTFDLVVFVQGDSAASRWANGLAAGEVLHFLGPASSVTGPTGDEPWVGVYGDETALALAEVILSAVPSRTAVLGAIETRPEDAAAVEPLALEAVARGTDRGAGLLEHARTVALPDGAGVVWLSGETTSVVALRDVWLQRGIPRDRLRMKPYWSVRGKGHRKTVEKTVLR